MELALNLGWLLIVGLLFASVGWEHRRGRLRLPLKLALGCAAVLALLLFPAISMTDDLQQAQQMAEGQGLHLVGVPDSGPDAAIETSETALAFWSSLLLAMAGCLLVLLARLFESRRSVKSRGRQQPYAVRPPPFVFISAA